MTRGDMGFSRISGMLGRYAVNELVRRMGFPSIAGHRRFVTAIAIDALGSGVCQ